MPDNGTTYPDNEAPDENGFSFKHLTFSPKLPMIDKNGPKIMEIRAMEDKVQSKP